MALPPGMFSAVGYKAIDYSYEASAKHRLMMDLLTLPVPVQVDIGSYPHTGKLRDKGYRTPWGVMEETTPELEDLKEDLRPDTCLETCVAGVCELGGDVVWGSLETLCVLERGERTPEEDATSENFSTAETHTTRVSYQDLYLTEEMITSDYRRRSGLPSLLTLLKRFRTLPVPDPLDVGQPGSVFSELLTFRRCAPYEASSGTPAAPPEVEEFRREPLSGTECLVLPALVETGVARGRGHMTSVTGLQEALGVGPELAEEPTTVLESLREGVPHVPECESFSGPEPCGVGAAPPGSPVPFRSHVEFEADPPLSSPSRPPRPERPLPPAEPLSPVAVPRRLLSEGERGSVERAVWLTEKHQHCVAALLLAEPGTTAPPVRRRSLSELLSVLRVERDSADTPLTEMHIDHALTLTEALARGSIQTSTRVDTTDTFTWVSIPHTDVCLEEPREEPLESSAPHSALPSVARRVKFILLEQSTPCRGPRPGHAQPGNARTPSCAEHVESTAPGPSVVHPYTHHVSESHGTPPEPRPNPPSVPRSTGPVRSGAFRREETCPATPGCSHLTSNRSVVTRLLSENSDAGNTSHVTDPGASISTEQSSPPRRGTAAREHMDPLSSFMMLRSLARSTAVLRGSEQTPPGPSGQLVDTLSVPAEDQSPADVRGAAPRRTSEGNEKAVSTTIRVPATDGERAAYQELHLVAVSVLIRVQGSGPNTLKIKDFSSLTPDHTRFSLKQQEKLISSGQGMQSVYNDVALLHILVTVKDLLLRCDLSTATDFLNKACSSSTMSSLQELLRKLQVLRYLSRTSPDPQPRVQQLQEQVNIWLQRNTSNKVLIVTAQERVRTELVFTLSQILGNSVVAVLTEQDSKLESRHLTNRRCAVVCVQQIQPGFPWRCFSAVLEFECLGQSAVRNICTQNNISYSCFITAAPPTDSWLVFSSPLDRVPFLLFITEGLLKRSDLLQLLESTYNVTLLERSLPRSMQALGSTEMYDLMVVDENTAVLLQELAELEQERASERVVIRMSAISLQFRRCWVLLHFTEHHRALVCGTVLTNLMLIYSASVLFGNKSGDLDVKVLLVCDEADIAQCVYRICFHTLLTSERDVCDWLNRDWFSVLPTQEEQFLLCFPCINSVVAQLMLSRAPSLEWLLEASHTQLEEMFPEVTPAVCKLFADITAQHRLSASACETDSTHAQSGPSSWTLNTDQSQTRAAPFTRHTGAQCPSWDQGDTRDQSYPGAGKAWTLDSDSHTPHTPFSQNLCVRDNVRVYHQSSPALIQHSAEQSPAQHTESYSGRKRPADPVVREPPCKRGRLQCERIPGRWDGQTRLSFF